jgi:hypothetical protein
MELPVALPVVEGVAVTQAVLTISDEVEGVTTRV